MNDQTPSPLAPHSPSSSRRRRRVLPSVAAALTLGLAGTGVGYVAVASRPTDSGSTGSGLGTTSTQVLVPARPDPYGANGTGNGYGYTDPYSPYDSEANGSSSTDTTSEASGAQLTGLVRIATTMTYDGASAAGTGMVLTSDGEVVTNHHVVEGATSIKVTVMATGATYTASVVGSDATDDMAVLQLEDASGLDTVATDDDGVSTGETVTAVGDGNGTVDHLSAATGTVIATDQSITTQSEGTATGQQLTDLMEISSDVVPGYSGGATYDADGEVVGMTTAASSGTADIVGYAIPIAKVLAIADDLDAGVQQSGYTYGSPAFLGIGLGSGTTVQGVYDDTPAADAGLTAGDRIDSVGGIRTSTATQLQAAIASHSPGDEVRITWTGTDGRSHSATATLAKGPVE
jgi:S1-C subfamily serine protease